MKERREISKIQNVNSKRKTKTKSKEEEELAIH